MNIAFYIFKNIKIKLGVGLYSMWVHTYFIYVLDQKSARTVEENIKHGSLNEHNINCVILIKLERGNKHIVVKEWERIMHLSSTTLSYLVQSCNLYQCILWHMYLGNGAYTYCEDTVLWLKILSGKQSFVCTWLEIESNCVLVMEGSFKYIYFIETLNIYLKESERYMRSICKTQF